jgi:hypothetical protein
VTGHILRWISGGHFRCGANAGTGKHDAAVLRKRMRLPILSNSWDTTIQGSLGFDQPMLFFTAHNFSLVLNPATLDGFLPSIELS